MKAKRVPKRRKEISKIFDEARLSGIDVQVGKFERGELMELMSCSVVLVDDKPVLVIEKGGTVVPHLLSTEFVKCRTLTVDDGAVPHIMSGAHVMAPGVVSHDAFEAGMGILVLNITGKPIASGVALMSSRELDVRGKGRVIRIVHKLRDDAYEAALTL